MCTVTFIARDHGFVLGMNRDEKRARPKALPPAIHTAGDLLSIYPSEPVGGTWIGSNELGITFCLINWYSIESRLKPTGAVSRGTVIPDLLAAQSIEEASVRLKGLALSEMRPFRLIGIFPAHKLVVEWQWNGLRLKRLNRSWVLQIWISSGFDEAGAEVSRRDAFKRAQNQRAPGTLSWLRKLHKSHRNGLGPYSLCMHRKDAVTVSYTEVIVKDSHLRMRYQHGSPCSCAPAVEAEIPTASFSGSL